MRGKTPIILVGSIQGDQETTRQLVEALIDYFQKSQNEVFL
jgi:hypothetical protein